MQITLDHIQLAMPAGGEERARTFFSGILKMQEEQKPEVLASRGGCWFRTEKLIIHVGVDPDFKPQKKAHPAFLTHNLKELASTLQQANFPVSWDTSLPDRNRFFTKDPFGNRIEFLQFEDGFSQRANF